MMWQVVFSTLKWLLPILSLQILIAVWYFHAMGKQYDKRQVETKETLQNLAESEDKQRLVSLNEITPKRDYKKDLISEGFDIDGYDIKKHGKTWFTAEKSGHKLNVYMLDGRGYKYLDSVYPSKYLPYLLNTQNLLMLELVNGKLNIF